MLKKCFVMIFIFALAQSSFADSYYSAFGLGLPRYFSNSKSAGMGGASIAVRDRLGLNSINPAAVNIRGITTLAVDFRYEYASIETAGNTVNIRDGNPAGFMFVLPVMRTLNFITSLTPRVASRYMLSQNSDYDGYEYEKTLSGHGGISSANVGFEYLWGDRLSVASQIDFFFGTYREEWQVDFTDPTFTDGNDDLASHVRGLGFEIGLYGHPTTEWALGLIYKSNSSLTAETTTEILSSYETLFSDQTLSYPHSIGVGSSFQIKKVLLALDMYVQRWSESELTGPVGNPLQDTWRVGGGLEYNDTKNPYLNYFRRMTYRLGAYHAKLPFENLNESFVSVGLSLPFHQNAGRIDLALEAGVRGNTTDLPYQETLFRFSCSVMGSELWFQRPVR